MRFSVAWSRGKAVIASATGPRYTAHTPDVGQRLSCRITATGAYGHASASSSPSAIIAAAPIPDISAFAQSARSWVEDNHLVRVVKARARKLRVGTTFTFRLSQPATVTLTFRKSAQGSKPIKLAGALTLTGQQGLNQVEFGGRVSRHLKLKPGSYVVTITATALGRTSASRSLRFTIARHQPSA